MEVSSKFHPLIVLEQRTLDGYGSFVEKPSASHRHRLGPGSCRLDQRQDKGTGQSHSDNNESLFPPRVRSLYLNVHNIRNIVLQSCVLGRQQTNFFFILHRKKARVSIQGNLRNKGQVPLTQSTNPSQQTWGKAVYSSCALNIWKVLTMKPWTT